MRAALLLLTLAGRCIAADQWVRVVTPHFEFFTDDNGRAARDLIEYFEQVRGFFLKVSPVRLSEDFPVRLIAFKNREQFLPYSPRPMSGAYYIGSPKGDYIVMEDLSTASYKSAVHEYTHLIVRHSGLRIPVWLNEGWADVYSSLRSVKGGVAIGDLLPERMKLLEGVPWLDFETLTSVTPQSAIYNEGDRTGMFYGESWALAHMLFLAPDYKQNFAKFVMSLHRGSTAAQACENAYHKSAAEVFKDLRTYFDRRKLYGTVFEATLEGTAAAPVLSAWPEFDARLILADLQIALGRFDLAALEYETLSKSEPNRPEIPLSLGYIAVMKGDLPQALKYFEKSYAEGGSDPRMCLALAQMELANKEPPGRIIPMLERALQAKPGYPEALLQLGLMKVADGQFEAGIQQLTSIKKVNPDRAPAVFISLAYAYLETGDLENARENVEIAKKWVRMPEDTKRLVQLASFIEARAKLPVPPHPGEKLQSVEGLVQTVECSSAGNRLRLQSGERSLEFVLPDSAAIEFTFKGNGALQISCGAQKPFHVRITYAAVSVMEQGMVGVVRRLDY